MKKFENIIYDEIHDSALKSFLLDMFVGDLKETHEITEIIYLPKTNKWLIKLEKDYIKAMQSE